MIRRPVLAVVLMTAVALAAQPSGLRNGGFEDGEIGGVPAGWELEENSTPAGYRVALSGDGPKSGAHAAMLVRAREAKAPGAGVLRQKLDSVALKVRPPAPPRAFEGRGLDNAVAFTRLLGYVRYFHPSDEAAAADWDRFAIEGIGDVETAGTPDALARLLQERFGPVAPTVRVYAGTPPPLPADLKPSKAARRAVMWKHRGIGIRPGPQTPYKSERRTAGLVDGRPPEGMADPASPLVVDLGGGVKAAVPLALWSDGTGTLPRSARAPAPPSEPAGPITTSAADRATRLADVALAWNVFQHFYPYFDVVPADWPASLRQALASAATDDERTFGTTLQTLVAGLHDGHGGVSATADAPARLPLAWDWIEGTLVVTEVAAGETAVRRGDLVEAIGGRPAAAVIAERERLISGATPQWRRYRALNGLRAGPAGEVALTLTADGAPREVRVPRTTTGAAVSEPRPGPIAEVGPGIMYLDPARVSDAEFNAALPRLSRARGVIFEMRGYPRLSPVFLRHLTDSPVQSAQWLVPMVTRPDREGWTFDTSGRWTLTPLAPRLAGRIAFVTDGSAISYAESCMGIVEHYKLGEIVGGPTAGTNGNVNPFTLPGGFTIFWTGMKVLKHDGSRHHGVGIQPTIPVSRTIAGVRAGRDEVLERAIEVVSR